MDDKSQRYELIKSRENLLAQKKYYESLLPHLYGHKMYKWMQEYFYDCSHRYSFIVAGNQLGKSTIQVRKAVEWATNKKLWPKLWPGRTPQQFWYLYPTKEVASIEIRKKWIPEILPRGEMQADPTYGWELETRAGFVNAIHFKSGISIYIKTYATDVQNLQTGSADFVLADEEMPCEIFPEINMRIAATRGYFSMVFTATLGQEFWREVMEMRGEQGERLPEAFKLNVSTYDCQRYADGTPSFWTDAYINQVKNSCGSEQEVLKRVYGRFITSEGLKYGCFSRANNIIPKGIGRNDWNIFVGIDIGSGGANNHPAAICFVRVNPLYNYAEVFKSWRGDGEKTSSYDILLKYRQMKGDLQITCAYYDHASKEFSMICDSNGEPVQKAEKSHDVGDKLINVLFKNKMLALIDAEYDNDKLVNELIRNKNVSKKESSQVDDLSDALRYAVSSIPWNWSNLSKEEIVVEEETKLNVRETKDYVQEYSLDDDLDYWNGLY